MSYWWEKPGLGCLAFALAGVSPRKHNRASCFFPQLTAQKCREERRQSGVCQRICVGDS
jgi:hypothetical protein